MVYISGEEMTKYCMDLILDQWIRPHVDISAWQFYDLSCVSRDSTEDQCLRDAVEAGTRVGAIFKEPTVTPTEVQKELLGLKKTWGSPNGAMRRGWNGITISRDTIHIEGMAPVWESTATAPFGLGASLSPPGYLAEAGRPGELPRAPSDFPSDFPSDVPSDFPSGLPSRLILRVLALVKLRVGARLRPPTAVHRHPPVHRPSGMELGYKNPVLFERHAIGGEYGAGYKTVGKGNMTTTFRPDDGGAEVIVDQRNLSDAENAVVPCRNL